MTPGSPVRWGFIVDANPVTVLFPGDDAGVEISYRTEGVMVAAGDHVWLIEVAAHQWMLGGKIVAVT